MAFLNEVSAKELDARKATHFFKHILKAHLYLFQKKKKKEIVAAQIDRIKRITESEKVDRFLLMQELKRLEKQFGELMEKETEIIKKQSEEEKLLSKMQETLEKAGISIVGEAKPLEDFEKIGKEVREIKEEIKTEYKATEDELKSIESRLNVLENKLNALKKSKKYKKELLAPIEQKIKEHKKMIKELTK